jgi:hypothetical protein
MMALVARIPKTPPRSVWLWERRRLNGAFGIITVFYRRLIVAADRNVPGLFQFDRACRSW